ncbi:MAG: MMPL family transporter [Prevotella sp.]|nr:MMPL family transporter [Prevotella sp.]
MTNLFIRLYHYFRDHQLVCWLSMVALFVFFGWFATRIHLEEDIDKLMPSSKNEDGSTKLAFADLKIKDKTFLLFEWQGDGTPDPARLSEVCDQFVDTLLRHDSVSQTIEDIFYQLPDDLMMDGIDYLMGHFPAYIDTSAYALFDTLLTREHFVRQMRQNYDDLQSEVGELFPELIQMDPMGMRNVLADRLQPLLEGGTGSYQTIDSHFFVPDSTVCLAFITPHFSATNTGQGSALFEMMNEAIEKFAVAHPDVRISYHGTPASGYYNSSQIKHDLTTTITGALVLVLVFLLVSFRRWNTIPLLLLPVVFGTLFGLTMMYFIKGQFSLLALGIGGVVLGVALSYVLHVLTHEQYVGDTERMLRDQVKPVWLGCLTTIGSFAGLIFIQTSLLQDFGLFAAFAILGTTLFSLTYLPQFLGRRGEQTSAHSFAWIDQLNAYPFDRKKPLLVVLVVIMVVCVSAYLVGGTRFDADMHNLGYDAPLTEHSEQLLREKTYTGDKQKYFASKGKTMEEAIEHFSLLEQQLDSLQQLGLVKSYTPTNQIFVPMKVQQQRIMAWKAYWTEERQAKVRQLIAETTSQAGLRPEAFDTFFETVAADYEPDALYEAHLIPAGYQSTLMEESYDGNFLCFTSVRCANDSVRSSESDYIRICDAVARYPDLLVLDTYYYTTDTLLRMNEDFNVLQWLSMAFVFAVLLLSFHFNLRHAVLGFLPILLSWMIVLGAMVLFDIRFNLISIIISTFIFGIGVDYSIFVIDGLTHQDQQKLTYHKTAIFLSAVTLITTVSSMLIASHPAIRSVGFSTLVGLLAAVILSYVLQPAVYRWLQKRKA